MNFPDVKLNIELDGPSHNYPARARYDRARDEFISVTKGYEVYRILIAGKSVDEVIEIITKKLEQRKEVYMDAEIQALYSKK